MADFATTVELGLEVDDGELRSARRAIEDGLGDVSVGAGGGAAARATDGGTAGGGRRQRRMFRWARERTNMMSEVVTLLGDIEEKVGGGGGGGGGGLLSSLGGVGLGGILFGGSITGTLSVAASKVISITASTWAASKIIAISSVTWAASKIISIGASTWAATKLLTITAGTWAAGKLIAIGSTITAAASSLLTIGTAITAGAATLITIGSVLTLDALELIDIGELIERDWDDVITLEGSVPFDIGQATRQAFEADTPEEGARVARRFARIADRLPGGVGGLFPDASQIQMPGHQDASHLGGGASARSGSTSPTVQSNATYEVNGQTQDEIMDEVARMQEEERRRLERALEQRR